MKVQSFLLAGAVALSAAGVVRADVVQSDNADYEAYFTVNSSNQVTGTAISDGLQGDIRVGARTTSTKTAGIFPFALPSLTSGQIINSATLTFHVRGDDVKTPLANSHVDLYGLPFDQARFEKLASLHFQGANDTTAGVSKLQEDFISASDVPQDGTPLYQFVTVDVSTYLNNQYDAGAVAGDFAVFRLSQDIVSLSGDSSRYRFVASAGDGSGGPDANAHTIADGAPYLTYSVGPVPEPSSAALLGLAALGLCARRRRSHTA
jgi:hypothetical protein